MRHSQLNRTHFYTLTVLAKIELTVFQTEESSICLFYCGGDWAGSLFTAKLKEVLPDVAISSFLQHFFRRSCKREGRRFDNFPLNKTWLSLLHQFCRSLNIASGAEREGYKRSPPFRKIVTRLLSVNGLTTEPNWLTGWWLPIPSRTDNSRSIAETH